MAVSDLRWAARLAFCEELWRDRARIVWDRRIEAVLAASVAEPDEDDPLARLVDAVVPRRAALDGARKRIDVSMGVGEEPIARRLAPRRPGTQFLTFGPLCEAIRRRDWDVALLDLSDLLMVDEPGGPSRLSMRGTELIDAVASRLTEADAEDDDGPAVVLGVLAETPGGGDAVTYGVDFSGLLELLEPLLQHDVPVRLYGMLRPTMAALVELSVEDDDGDGDDDDEDLVDDLERTLHEPRSGPPLDSTFPVRTHRGETEDEAKTAELRPRQDGVSVRRGSGTWRDGPRREWSAAGELEITSPLRRSPPEAVTARIGRRADVEDEGEEGEEGEEGDEGEDGDDGEDVPLSFDNTLGAVEPTIVEYVVVAGAGIDDAVADGMTLIELPELAAAIGIGLSAEGAPAPLRAQLAESRRQVDLSAIERQRLVERLDNLESANTELRTEAADLRDRLARALTETAPAQGQERLDMAQAELQSLRWQLTQTQRSLDAARARPVEELEAEVAMLSARLSNDEAPPSGRSNGQAGPPVSSSPTGLSSPAPIDRPADGSKAGGTRVLLARVDAMVQRVERSDISALELRKRLVELRDGLTRLLPGSGG